MQKCGEGEEYIIEKNARFHIFETKENEIYEQIIEIYIKLGFLLLLLLHKFHVTFILLEKCLSLWHTFLSMYVLKSFDVK